MPSSRIRLAGLFTFVLALTGCAATDVSSYVAHGVALQAHHTYNWATVDARSTGDPRLDNNRFFEDRVQAAIEKQLASLGFRKTASAGLLVRYHASVTQDISISGSEGNGDCDECRAEVYDVGTLLIDLVDAQSDRLVWRGWATGSSDGVVDDQQWMEMRIDEAVARIMR